MGNIPLDRLLIQLNKLHPKYIDLSLNRLLNLLKKLNNPQLKLPPTIHIAGTNGKGSTLSFIHHILKENNYKVYHYEIYQFSKENYYNGSKSIFIALGKNIDNDFMSIDEFNHMPGLFDISNGKE